MARKFPEGEQLERAAHLASVLYHDGNQSVRAIARHLKCSWHMADRLITYSRDKWDQRRALAGALPLHFDECVAAF